MKKGIGRSCICGGTSGGFVRNNSPKDQNEAHRYVGYIAGKRISLTRMKTGQFKVGDKVMLKVGGTTVDCVERTGYRFLHEGKPGAHLYYLHLVGKGGPSEGGGRGWPASDFRLIWSDDRAAH
jgi:hypothetical protein